jgi:hypothetical protein
MVILGYILDVCCFTLRLDLISIINQLLIDNFDLGFYKSLGTYCDSY